MSSKISLLDCTLRDGGYINDWEFGHDNIIRVFERLVNTGVDIIEVGFIDDRRPYDINRSIFPDTASIKRTFASVDKRPEMVVGMVDYGTCDIDKVENAQDSFLDGIRVIFKKQKMNEAMAYCKKLKDKGYKVFSQLVSITSYEKDDYDRISELVNEVHPYAVSIVDTYGLLDLAGISKCADELRSRIDNDICIGYHAHNNLQLGFANGICFLEKFVDDPHNILLDGTLYGMGKSAGNAPIELLSKHLNNYYNKCYNVHPMLEAIEESVKEIYHNSPWGYSTKYYLCAENKCHPSYVDYFDKKGNLSVSKLDAILARIEPYEKKLLYDKESAEQLYREVFNDYNNDYLSAEALEREVSGRTVMIVGPGKNIILQGDNVKKYVEKNAPYIISINYIPEVCNVDAVFVTKNLRYREMTDGLHTERGVGITIISTSNVEILTNKDRKGIEFNREPLLDKRDDIMDNSLLMLLKILAKANISNIAMAGLDGYSDKEDNYYEASKEYGFVKSIARNLNRRIREELSTTYKNMKVEFVTYSHYMNDEDIESGGF